MTTHFVQWDHARPGRKSIAICGDWCDAREESLTPSCPECQRELAKTAEDVFGTTAPGTPVVSTYHDPLTGYKAKTR